MDETVFCVHSGSCRKYLFQMTQKSNKYDPFPKCLFLPMRKMKLRRKMYPSGHNPFSRSIGMSENSISPTNIVDVFTRDHQGLLKNTYSPSCSLAPLAWDGDVVSLWSIM